MKNALTLGGGTVLAQALVAVSSPIIARLYSPHDFGVLGAFVYISAFPVVIVGWRYELAIVLPEDDRTAINVLALSLVIAFSMCVLSGVVVYVAGADLGSLLGNRCMSQYLWLLPLGIAGAGFFQIINYWAVRRKDFKIIVRAKFNQAFGLVLTQILMGIACLGPIGLLLGEIIGRTSGARILSTLFWKKNRRDFSAVSLTGMWSAAKRYRRFPILSAGATLLNQGGMFIPALLLGSLYGMETLGWFTFAQKLIGWPSMLLSQAVGQIYLGEASRLIRSDPAAAQKLFLNTLTRVFVLAVGPMIVLAVVAPTLFVFAFGPSWAEAGKFARFLSVAYLARSAVVPIAATLNIVERQDLQLCWDVSRLVLVLAGITYAHACGWSADSAVIVYALLNALAYVGNGFLCSHALSAYAQATTAENI
jgi:O-antigen/teichoic acid export membrane protein